MSHLKIVNLSAIRKGTIFLIHYSLKYLPFDVIYYWPLKVSSNKKTEQHLARHVMEDKYQVLVTRLIRPSFKFLGVLIVTVFKWLHSVFWIVTLCTTRSLFYLTNIFCHLAPGLQTVGWLGCLYAKQGLTRCGNVWLSDKIMTKLNQSHYRPEVPRGFQEVKFPRLRDNGPEWW